MINNIDHKQNQDSKEISSNNDVPEKVNNPTTICDLPKDMLSLIASHLSLKDILVDNVAMTDEYANENMQVNIIGSVINYCNLI